MIEETYLKEYHDEDDTLVVSFEGNQKDIYRLRDYAKMINSVKGEVEEEYYRGLGKNNSDCEDNYGMADEEVNRVVDMVSKPPHYRSGKIETIEKIEAVIDGLPAKQASCLANVLKYFDRAGLKDDAVQDLEKASNYAHRLVYGKWRHKH